MTETQATEDDLSIVPLDELPVNYNTLQTLIAGPTIPKRYRESPTGVNDMYSATLKGKELGIGPWTSIDEIYLVNGQTSMSGKMMLALVWRAGHRISVEIHETESIVHCYRRYDDEWLEVGSAEFSIEDAHRADLMDKGTYQSYPKTMLTWRAVSLACRLYFPDVILSVGYVPEEVGLNDVPVDPIPDYVIDGNGMLEAENAIIVLEDVLDAEVIDEE
jgi:hypothetical protein